MKKINLILIALVALIVMSCSKDETSMSIPQESNAIEFGTYVGRDAQTRAHSIENTTKLAADGGFGVFAYYKVSGTWANTDVPNFMFNQQVTGNVDGTTWTYTPVKYWPNNDGEKISFFAYAPYGATGVDIAAKAGFKNPQLTYTLQDFANQKDLLYAAPVKDHAKQNVGNKVSFAFKHALSRLGFKAVVLYDDINTAGDGTDDNNEGHLTRDENTKITVNSIKIGGTFIETSTLDLNSGNWTTPTSDFSANKEYTLDTSNLKDNAKGITGEKTTASINNDESYSMFLPGETKGITVTVNYDVITIDSKLPDGNSTINNVITSESFDFTFVQGKAYNFVLHLGLTSVKLTATVEGWGDESDISVNVPINTTAP